MFLKKLFTSYNMGVHKQIVCVTLCSCGFHMVGLAMQRHHLPAWTFISHHSICYLVIS
uniref:Uncharacterized protein n=1 Tax=Physcomitrium patens TaxID=3218 RepID=A0A2K1J5F2_PHYPA|nr:hypothetical protein PHYPA_022571 [Physcomitrium patens]